MRFLSLASDGLSFPNGSNGINGIKGVVGNLQGKRGWNSYFLPTQFSDSVLGTNTIHPDLLGPSGVGDLSRVPGIENNILDNRFISPELKEMLCWEDVADNNGEGITFRDYFSVLVDLAWPPNAEFRLCCSDAAGMSAVSHCLEPDFVFSSKLQVKGFDPLVLAPHFLTEKFGEGQQEALTAALIAKFNIVGKTLKMDLTGRFDLGLAGTRSIGGRVPGFDYFLGNAWGNMFLDCANGDVDNVLCGASTEDDRNIGRDSQYYGLPMFTCDGQSGYPTTEAGKACFSKNMETNIRSGCDWVAAVGPCKQVCVRGFCGINIPPLEHRGTTNVLYIYMSEYSITKGESTGLPLVSFFAVCAIVLAVLKVGKDKNASRTAENQEHVNGSKSMEETSTVIDSAEEFVSCQVEE